MNIKHINDKFAKHQLITGTHISVGNPMVTDVIIRAGFDALWIDTEHSAMDRQEILINLIAASRAGAAVFVRVPWNDPILVKPILEMGVDGIIFPMICSPAEAEKAVKSCLYPPHGIRGYGPLRASDYGASDAGLYVNQTSRDMWRIMQIEHIKAVENISEILAVEGVSAVVMGPMDLSASIGLLPDCTHPDVLKLIKEVERQAKSAGIPFGLSAGYNANAPSSIQVWMDFDPDFLFLGSDVSFLAQGSANTLRDINALNTRSV